MRKLHKQFTGDDFRVDSQETHEALIRVAAPIGDKDYNKVISALSSARDIKLVRKIIDLNQKGVKVFVVFGIGHLIMQEQALEKYIV
jgi:hypothetical protein